MKHAIERNQTSFHAKHHSELQRCQNFYSLPSLPTANEINTYEGWLILGRQVKRGAKGYHHSRGFCVDLCDSGTLPDAATATIRQKSARYDTVSMFHISCTEPKSTTKRKSRR